MFESDQMPMDLNITPFVDSRVVDSKSNSSYKQGLWIQVIVLHFYCVKVASNLTIDHSRV